MTKRICIVDAYSTGSELPQRFKAHSWGVVHVASNIVAPELTKSFDPSSIDEQFFEADFNSTEALIKALHDTALDAVVPGTETGIGLADKIANGLLLNGNNPRSSLVRRNKTLMQDALRRANIPYIRGMSAHSIHDILKFISSSGIQYPFIVKPEASAGSDDVYFCHNMTEIEVAYERVINKLNAMGDLNENVLIQECLVGNQYYVNGITIDSSHYFFEVWHEKKKTLSKNRIVCDKETLMDSDSNIAKDIMSYLGHALDALEIEWGATHSELMLTDRGPILIETAARMQGSFSSKSVEKVLGYSHPSTLVDSIIDPKKFISSQLNYAKQTEKFIVVLLISELQGTVIANNVEHFAAKLPSFVGLTHTVEPGNVLQPTLDFFTSPGSIYLAHERAEQVETDYKQIREWENQGKLYELE